MEGKPSWRERKHAAGNCMVKEYAGFLTDSAQEVGPTSKAPVTYFLQ